MFFPWRKSLFMANSNFNFSVARSVRFVFVHLDYFTDIDYKIVRLVAVHFGVKICIRNGELELPEN